MSSAAARKSNAQTNKPKATPSGLAMDKALTMSWPSHSAALAALKKAKFDHTSLGLILTPSEDDRKGYVLMHSTPVANDDTTQGVEDGATKGETGTTEVTEGDSTEGGDIATETEPQAPENPVAQVRSLRAIKAPKAKKVAPARERGTGMTYQFRRIVIENYFSDQPVDRAELMKRGRDQIRGINKTTLNVVYADTISAIGMIKGLGLLKADELAQDEAA